MKLFGKKKETKSKAKILKLDNQQLTSVVGGAETAPKTGTIGNVDSAINLRI